MAPAARGGRVDRGRRRGSHGWLARSRRRSTTPGSNPRLHEESPLLRQLVALEHRHATAPDDRVLLRVGAGASHTGCSVRRRGAATRSRELERLLRETLGLCAYRLDAWYTAVAAWRLENKRTRGRAGSRSGPSAGLRREAAVRRAVPGYVLAPSLTHATTAAVLRSGWAAFGGEGEGAGLAVESLVRPGPPRALDRRRRAPGPGLGAADRCALRAGLHDSTPGLDDARSTTSAGRR